MIIHHIPAALYYISGFLQGVPQLYPVLVGDNLYSRQRGEPEDDAPFLPVGNVSPYT